ncbi:MAG TPA: hypothetical protein VLZ05_23300 [Mycobacterium sp.]|nr:hypothetical protein [Mycobacterium sp.]HUH71549.1 hypothetical protein [Mycobacterium sp.]
MAGETLRRPAMEMSSARCLDTVTSNLLIWQDTARSDECCDECGAATTELVSPQHGLSCSLRLSNVV